MRNGQIKAAVIAGILAVGLLGSMAQVKVTRGWNVVSGLLQFGGSTSSFPALKQSGSTLQVRQADDGATAGISALSYAMGGSNVLLISSTAPTISSGFGTSPSIVSANSTASFRVNVGTGGVATSGVVGLPTAAGNGWSCTVQGPHEQQRHEA
jgi:hypothetical protein